MTTTPNTNHYSKSEAVADSDTLELSRLVRTTRKAFAMIESVRYEISAYTDATGHVLRADEKLSQAKRLIAEALREMNAASGA